MGLTFFSPNVKKLDIKNEKCYFFNMRYELKPGSKRSYYSFSYYCKNDKKNKRIPNCDVLYFWGSLPKTEAEAKRVGRVLTESGAYPEYKPIDTVILQKELLESIPTNILVQEYATKYLPNRCINSSELTLFYLKNYALHFYLSVIHEKNFSKWSDYYYDYRVWLNEKAKQIKFPEKLLGISTKNHCIRALNSFMSFLEEKRVIKKAVGCKGFDLSRKSLRGLESVVNQEEFDLIYSEIQKNNLDASELYILLYNTGMRINEALGVSLADIYIGKDLLQVEKYYKCYGYIILQSQPDRVENGIVIRKPLKGKKVIGGKNTRTIPILDERLFGIIAKNYNRELEKWNQKRGDKRNYLLFSGSKGILSNCIKRASEGLGINYRSPHCLRHSFCTYFIGKTQNFLLAKQVLGHSSLATTERYQHLSSLLVQEVAREEMGFINI